MASRHFPLVQRLPERFFLIKHLTLGEENEVVSVNGQINPAIAMRAGEMRFWRIAHIGASQFFKFRIEGCHFMS
jgi:suppressor of ftsI